MIILLHPDKIIQFTPLIKEALRHLVPKDSQEEVGDMLLVDLVSGKIQAWLQFEEDNGERKVLGIVLTTQIQDPCLPIKDLLICGAYSQFHTSNGIWKESAETLKRYARSRGCKRITAYTNVPRLIDLFKEIFGGERVMYCMANIEIPPWRDP